MKSKLIIFDYQKLHVEFMHCFLKKNGIAKEREIKGIIEFDDVQNHILEKDSLLFFNISGFNKMVVTDHVENFLLLNATLKIIIQSGDPDVTFIKKLFDKGIKCYLGRHTTSEEFIEAFKSMDEGKVFVNDNSKNALLDFVCKNEDENERTNEKLENLTLREKDVLLLICEGLRSKDIAEKLIISIHTVESHRRNILQKFNLKSSSQLVKFTLENRIV